jgi:alanine racemase
MNLTWLEISQTALAENLKTFRKLIGKERVLAAAVKGNAYGHGLLECARIFEQQSADYLCVNAVFEARNLRENNIKIPILIIGYTSLKEIQEAVDLKCEITCYNIETLKALSSIKRKVNIHLKIETGTHRQGIGIGNLNNFIPFFKRHTNVNLKGVSTHLANLEDRINHQYALMQLQQFKNAVCLLENHGLYPQYQHCANSAAALLMPEAHFNFVRIGIGNYGLWPSEKTKRATRRTGLNIQLQPALTWKTIVAKIKKGKKGALISYGCTYEMRQNGQIAVLPIGYYDGYVRKLSNKGYVLIRGQKAPIVGRVCMNMTMVDITAIPNVKLEDEVVLIGRQREKIITVEQVAKWSDTINYEVTTRINEKIPRRFSSKTTE